MKNKKNIIITILILIITVSLVFTYFFNQEKILITPIDDIKNVKINAPDF